MSALELFRVSSCLPIVAQQIKVMAVDRYRAGCEQGPDAKD